MADFADRVRDTTTTTGTGDITLAGSAPSGFRTFASAFSVADRVYYAIVGASGEWEVGIGVLSASTTLQRTTVLASSNAGAAVNFSAGTKDVFCNIPALPLIKATAAQIRASTPDKHFTTDGIEIASALVALTINTTPSPDEVTTNGTILDWDAFINATLTHTANMTLLNPSNGQPGTWRSILFTQHTSPVTITLGNQYKTPGAEALTVSVGSGEKDLLTILCVSASEFWLFVSKDMS